jgi:hypothetical protein
MVVLLAPRPTPNLEDHVSVFMTPEDRVAQLYPRVMGGSGTSGVPLPVPTVVDPWGEELTTPSYLNWLTCNMRAVLLEITYLLKN